MHPQLILFALALKLACPMFTKTKLYLCVFSVGMYLRTKKCMYDHAAEVEETVFFHIANLFNLDVDLFFYDTTTVSFTTVYEDDPDDEDISLRQFGC